MKKLKACLLVLISLLILGATAYGLQYAAHSPLFLIRVVEIEGVKEDSPVDAETIHTLAAIPVEEANLFDFDLAPVEKRILTQSWIREVHLQKRFPQTLSIQVVFREAKAVVQLESGKLSYIDTDGTLFGKLSLATGANFPVLVGFSKSGKERRLEALHLVSAWEQARMESVVELSSLSFDDEHGFRAFTSYPLGLNNPAASSASAIVDLGQGTRQDIDAELVRLKHVFQYLTQNKIQVRQVWADIGKKVVVKTGKGS